MRAFPSRNEASFRPYPMMTLLSFLVLLSTAQLIIAPPSMLQPNSTTTMSNSDRKDSAANNQKVSAPLVGSLNMSVSTSAQIATSTWLDQREFIDLEGLFQDLNPSLSRYCLHVYESAYLSWKTTNTQTTSVLTCRSTVAESPCLLHGTYVETDVPQFTPKIKPPCCGPCFIAAQKAQAFFWPTPAPQPNISTLVGTDGFT